MLTITEFTTTQNGGTDVLGYQVQIDDGNNGPYKTVLGGSENTLDTQVSVTSGIVKGLVYRVRYRAVNSIGPGDWSDVSYIPAATVPVAPTQP